MREILFRGKRVDSGEWVYGNLNYGTIEIESIKDSYFISDFNVTPWDKKFFPVISETVGQSTGLTDKNGRKIFEGDIIHLEYSQVFFGGVYFGEYTAEVSYKEGCFITDGINNGDEIETPLSGFDNDEVEIIGNIHDNPELVGGESDG